jgi:hypothetical protein
MDSIPIQTSLVFNEKIWGNCHHRIHQRTSQHRICVLRLYLARLTKKRHGTSPEIQYPTCQTTRDQKALKVIITTKRALRLQRFKSVHSINRRNYPNIKKLVLLDIWSILLSSKHPIPKHTWCGFKDMLGPLDTSR